MPASAELADKPQLALREAVRESDLLMHCKGAFIVGSTGNDGQDALRKLVVELFQASAARNFHELHDHQGNRQRQYSKSIETKQHAGHSTYNYTKQEAMSVVVLVSLLSGLMSLQWSNYPPPLIPPSNAVLSYKGLCMPAGE